MKKAFGPKGLALIDSETVLAMLAQGQRLESPEKRTLCQRAAEELNNHGKHCVMSTPPHALLVKA